MSKNPLHLDAGEKTFFQRQLEKVKTRTYDKKYKNLKAKQMIPVSSEAGSGATHIVWYSWDKIGTAKVISSYSDDFPRADVFATENTARVRDLGSSYGYSIKDIRSAMMAGGNLQQRKADASRRSIEELIDDIAWNGLAAYNIQGFLDYPGITEYTIPNGAGGFKPWSTKTPDEIIADLTGMMSAVSVPTKGVEEVNQFLIPREQYDLIRNTRMTDGNDKTILQFFLSNNPGVMVDVLDLLDGKGAGATDRAIAYVKDPEHLTLELPQMFEQFDADKKGMEYVVPCHAEIAGVIIYYPQSVVFADNI